MTPLPLSETVWGLPVALSATESVPLTLPVAVGLKVTLIVQVAADATGVAQLSVSEKSALAVIPVMSSDAFP